MKRSVVFLLVIIIIFSLISCAKNDEQETAETTPKPTLKPVIGIELDQAALNYFQNTNNGNNIIPWVDLQKKIDNGDEPFILSIRKKEDYDAGHIEGAYHAAWGEDLASKFSMLPKDETVYVYCYSGQTAGQAVALLRLLEIDAVSVKSGFNNGISKTEGYEDYLQTTANDLTDTGEAFNEEAFLFVEEYFATVTHQENFMISAEELSHSIHDGTFRFLDIRKGEDIEMFPVADESMCIPFGEWLIEDAMNHFGRDEKIVVGCYTGQTAGQATAVLRALGYEAYSLKGGVNNGWKKHFLSKEGEMFFTEPFDHGINSPWHMLSGAFNEGLEEVVIDLRSAEDYAESHVQGAVNAPFGQKLADILDTIPKDSQIWLYCYTGQTSAMAAPIIRMAIENGGIYSLEGGFNGKSRKQHMQKKYLTDEPGEFNDGFYSYDEGKIALAKEFLIDASENGNNMMSNEDLVVLLEAQDSSVIVLDIRKEKDFVDYHIDGALNKEFSFDILGWVEDLPDDKIIIAGYDGQYAGYLVTVLRMKGYDAVSLKSGMHAWKEADLPLAE